MSPTSRPEPSVSVVVCTRGRPESAARAVRSILADARSDFELLVIDQSPDEQTRRLLAELLADRRLRYIHSDSVGVSRSRNLAVLEARSDIVISTDDDCVVPVGWIDANVRAVRSHPRAAMVFGDVVAPAGESNAYLPESISSAAFEVTQMSEWRAVDGVNVGIGASMAMRRAAIIDIGLFDEQLGPGTPIGGGEDTDIALRAVLAGYSVARVTDVRVEHHGSRSHDEFRLLIRRSMFSTGAVLAKLARRRPLAGVRLTAAIAWRLVFRPAVTELARGRRPPVLGRAVHLLKGLWVGGRLPLDKTTGRFADDGSARVGPTPPTTSGGDPA